MYGTQTHGDALTERQRETVDDLLELLEYLTVGREYFKTLYFKRELADLSRGLLAISFPAVVFVSFALLALHAGLVSDWRVGRVPSIVVFVGITYVVGLAPYTLFSAHVFRTATIALDTLAAGPFLLQGSDADRIEP